MILRWFLHVVFVFTENRNDIKTMAYLIFPSFGTRETLISLHQAFKMAKTIFILCLFNFYTVFAIRRESVHMPNKEEKAARESNADGNRDGKCKLLPAYGH